MAMHYVYLVGLALWDNKARAAAIASQATASAGAAFCEGAEQLVAPAGLKLAYSKVPMVDVDGSNHGGTVKPPL